MPAQPSSARFTLPTPLMDLDYLLHPAEEPIKVQPAAISAKATDQQSVADEQTNKTDNKPTAVPLILEGEIRAELEKASPKTRPLKQIEQHILRLAMEAHESKHAMQEAEQEEIVSENKLVESIAIPVVLNVVAMKHTVFLTELASTHAKSTDFPPMPKDPKSIQSAVFPSSTSIDDLILPKGLSSKTLADSVVKANEAEISKKTASYMASDQSRALISDIFWWAFADKFTVGGQHDIDKIYDRIAANFAELFLHSMQNGNADQLTLEFPSLLGQSIYTAFCKAWPASYKQLSKEFKQYIGRLVVQWITGMAPHEDPTKDWKINELMPELVLEHEGVQSVKTPKTTIDQYQKPDQFIIDTLHRIDHPEVPKRQVQNIHVASSPMSAAPRSLKEEFDVLGNSPLIKHYLSVRLRKQRNIIRSIPQQEVTQEAGSEAEGDNTSMNNTYHTFLSSFDEQLQIRQHTYHDAYDALTALRNKATQSRIQRVAELEKEGARAMLRPKEFSDKICEAQMLDRRRGTGGRGHGKKKETENFTIRIAEKT